MRCDDHRVYYDDLTPYEYTHDEVWCDRSTGMHFLRYETTYQRLNIGWLQADQPWTAAPAPEGFASRLLAIIDAQDVNSMLGHHECDLCPTSLPLSHPWYEPRPGHQRASVDTSEIRVPANDNVAYAAPHLVGHYVTDHGYLPPQPFIDAVLAFDPHSSWPTHCPQIRFPWIPSQARLRFIDDGDFWDDHVGT
jgi:hypothetical protein